MLKILSELGQAVFYILLALAFLPVVVKWGRMIRADSDKWKYKKPKRDIET